MVNKIADVLLLKTLSLTKPNDDNFEKQGHVEEIIIPPEKKEINIKQIEKRILKMAHYKISKLLNDPTVSKLEARKRIEVNDL